MVHTFRRRYSFGNPRRRLIVNWKRGDPNHSFLRPGNTRYDDDDKEVEEEERPGAVFSLDLVRSY